MQAMWPRVFLLCEPGTPQRKWLLLYSRLDLPLGTYSPCERRVPALFLGLPLTRWAQMTSGLHPAQVLWPQPSWAALAPAPPGHSCETEVIQGIPWMLMPNPNW